MKVVKITAIALIVVGILGLVYGSFTYIKDIHKTDLGVFELSIKDKETVKVPVWTGVGAIVAGGLLLLYSAKKH